MLEVDITQTVGCISVIAPDDAEISRTVAGNSGKSGLAGIVGKILWRCPGTSIVQGPAEKYVHVPWGFINP